MVEASIFWFRRDLRIDDNPGLYEALANSKNVIPIFIFDTNIIDNLPSDDNRIKFIWHSLSLLNERLKELGSTLNIFKGNPLEVFKKIILKYRLISVYVNRDYEKYSIKRDKEINTFLNENKIAFNASKDHVFFEPNEILKSDGTPYTVFTPYSKKWFEKFYCEKLPQYQIKNLVDNFFKTNYEPIMSLREIGFSNDKIEFEKFNLGDELIKNYNSKRDFPYLNSTSKIGPYLRFGLISVREVAKKTIGKKFDQSFLRQLIWRDFYIQIFFHFPDSENENFKPAYDKIIWLNEEEKFEKWCAGETGYPIVDAGMKELNATGFMHNRVRMIASSFLCKHLLIHWKKGESYFAKKLLDYEMASNVGNWQWVAGTGVDAAPYFRLFNPEIQMKKFDPQKVYIKKWLPKYDPENYLEPIIDHNYARERCLNAYKIALNN
ncbi:MAG: deoxyribodipyrimidine photolyase [Flavobacteriaceae bacterium]|nr:deoxyribodipyrimidine photolyase [Flavobacteriaceae bacterium]